MDPDRSWMDRRIDDSGRTVSEEFRKGVKEFLDFAYSISENVSEEKIRCPCAKCKLKHFELRHDVEVHLYRKGFKCNYKRWSVHGERLSGESSRAESDHVEVPDEITNPYVDLVRDVAGQNFDWSNETISVEEPNSNAAKFFQILKDADEPLWPGCDSSTKLSAVAQLLNLKDESNMSQAHFNNMISIMKNTLPKDEKLPENYYKAKQMVKILGLGYQKIHACENDCMLYYKENEHNTHCSVCGHPRFKPKLPGNETQKDIPCKVLRYFPLTPRLQRLYMSNVTSEHMTWHKNNPSLDGGSVHPSDSEAWKHFDRTYPSFAAEARNVRVGLSTDGFNPFGHFANSYSCWPVIIAPYNLPPWMCMKQPYMFLTLVIPGPRSPSKNLDVYLRPLIDELKSLWNDGVNTYDSFSKENFQMKVALMWTISDFPAYGMLSGWSTHGKMCCPYCMEGSKALWLENGGKASFFDCHRQFLPPNHPYRKQKDKFKKNTVEHGLPPPRLSSEEVFQRVQKLPPHTFGKVGDTHKINGYGKEHNWVKCCIFWELPYWRSLLIRHNLDVMHIEKNVFENLFYTIFDVKGKTKDNVNARKDLKILCKRPELELLEINGKTIKPKATYTLTKAQVKDVCEWVKQLKLPDGYASNISRCVNVEDCKFSGLKSHDCHVFMERLLPIALRDMLPKPVWDALTDLCYFFKDLCSTTLRKEHMEILEKNIATILCNLEKIFPPSFFDSMEHLPIHLAYEAKVGGPVQYRWMYPFERSMFHLKRKVKNKACVEASICEAYNLQEISLLCSHYFESTVHTRLNQVPRNDDGGEVDPNGRLSIFSSPGRVLGEVSRRRILQDDEMKAAHIYALLNCDELMPFLEKFDRSIRSTQPLITKEQLAIEREQKFAKWLREHVTNDLTIDMRIQQLASGPKRHVKCYRGYYVNGFKFHTHAYGKNKSTVNSGVCIKGSCYDENEHDYYGLLVDIIELKYFGKGNKFVMFKCQWYDTVKKGIRVDSHGLVEIRHKKHLETYEPFILASQAHQVYYTTTPSRKRERKDWWNVIKTKSRRFVEPQSNPTQDFYQEEEEVVPIEIEIDTELDRDGFLASKEFGEEIDPNNVPNTSNEGDFIDDGDPLEFDSSPSSGDEMELDL